MLAVAFAMHGLSFSLVHTARSMRASPGVPFGVPTSAMRALRDASKSARLPVFMACIAAWIFSSGESRVWSGAAGFDDAGLAEAAGVLLDAGTGGGSGWMIATEATVSGTAVTGVA